MTHADDLTAIAGARAIVPFAEHRPETVPVATWVEYVALMSASARGRLTQAGLTRLDEICTQFPEIFGAVRGLDFSPRCSR